MSAAVMTLSPAAIDYDPVMAQLSGQPVRDPNFVRVSAAEISVSDAMKETLVEEEGVHLTVYQDVAGYPTVGAGHLVTPADGLRVGDRISYERAIKFLESDLAHAERAVRRLVGSLPLYQHEFDALVDLVYNVGEGNVSRENSPRLNTAIATGDHVGIAEQLAYEYAGGAVAKGLVYRSDRRQKIFMQADYSDPRPASISVSSNVSG